MSRIEPTSREAGYVNYDLHESLEKPGFFILYENWESGELLDAHLAAPHLVRFAGMLDDLVEGGSAGLSINRVHRIA